MPKRSWLARKYAVQQKTSTVENVWGILWAAYVIVGVCFAMLIESVEASVRLPIGMSGLEPLMTLYYWGLVILTGTWGLMKCLGSPNVYLHEWIGLCLQGVLICSGISHAGWCHQLVPGDPHGWTMLSGGFLAYVAGGVFVIHATHTRGKRSERARKRNPTNWLALWIAPPLLVPPWVVILFLGLLLSPAFMTLIGILFIGLSLWFGVSCSEEGARRAFRRRVHRVRKYRVKPARARLTRKRQIGDQGLIKAPMNS